MVDKDLAVNHPKRATGCKQTMEENIHDGHLTTYEVGYLLSIAITEEHILAEVDKIREIITLAGASIVTEGAPHRQELSYTMRIKTVSGSYQKFDEAYFGWIKFELESSKVELVKKSIEDLPSIIRILLVTTVKENTYLGKSAPAISTGFVSKRATIEGPVNIEKKDVTLATLEEMDKSIDEMVKEA